MASNLLAIASNLIASNLATRSDAPAKIMAALY